VTCKDCALNSACVTVVCIYDRNGVKMILGAGAVYVTVNEGVWSTSESGLNAAQRLRTYVLPETTQYWDKVIAFSVHCFVYLQQIHTIYKSEW